MEFYKEVARYRADIEHERSSDMIDYAAVVHEGPNAGEFYIRHSHTFRSNPKGGAYYSNTHIRATSPEEAEEKIREWCGYIARAHEVVEWSAI